MENQTREFKIFITSRDKTQRTISAAISSDTPVDKGFGESEVLVHTKEAVDLSRAPLPLLLGHDHGGTPVGIVENLKVAEGKLRGLLRFGNSAKAKEVWEDVKDGILRNLSIGYQILKKKQEGLKTYAIRWQPLEVSIVSVPADITVGINRSFNIGGLKTMDKRQEWVELCQKAKSILETARNENRGMSKEEAAEFQGHCDRFDELSLIVGHPDITIRALGVQGVVDRLSQPANRPLSLETDTQRQQRTGGRAETRAFTSLGEQLRCVAQAETPGGGPIDERLYRAATGLGETVPSDGGFLVQTDFSDQILQDVFKTGVLADMCRRIEISSNSNSLKIPGVDETARTTGNRFGGCRAYWIGEADEKTASKPKFRQIELNLHKCACLVYVTDELMSDSKALEDVVTRTAASELGFQLDDAIINGTGAGMPLGILNAGCIVSVSKEAGQAASTLVFENVVNMWTRLFASSRKTAVWLINQDVEPQLYSMSLAVGVGGAPIYMPSGGASATPYSTLFGRPVIPIEQCQTLGTKGDIYLADFENGYILAEKGGIQSAMSIHVRFIYDESVFRFVLRIDGQPVRESALTPYKGSNDLSHFVTLNARA